MINNDLYMKYNRLVKKLDKTDYMFDSLLLQAEIKEIDFKIRYRKIPKKYPDEMLSLFAYNSIERREMYIRQCGYALLSYNWIVPFVKWIGNRKVLEIMSGSGALARVLRKKKVNLIATDDFSWQGHWNLKPRFFTKIKKIDCIKAIEVYGNKVDLILCSWAYMDDTLYRALIKMREVNPKCMMVVIGENSGGCTANNNYFNAIEIIRDYEFEIMASKYQSWEFIHDYIELVK